MPEESVCTVLHITAAAGGGVDRYIRDLAANTSRRHLILHVDSGMDVLEDIGAASFTPLRGFVGAAATASVAQWLDLAGVAIVHLHSVDERCRARLIALLDIHPLNYLVTLHDLTFISPRTFELEGMPAVDTEWIDKLRPTLANAATVIAPSAFIADLARRCNPEIRIALIAPGIRTLDPVSAGDVAAASAEFMEQAPQHMIAMVGALGQHKGSGILGELAAELDGSAIGVVVVGYTDTQLARGWLVPGRVYVHGPYIDEDLAGWLAAYRAEVVLFPNRLPESFSYTLSEVWSCGLPVIVPDDGALGERVRRHGGGWTLPSGFSAADAAAWLRHLLTGSGEGAAELARVKSSLGSNDVQRIPSLEAMTRDIETLYARFGTPPVNTVDTEAAREALRPLLAVNLDGFTFRKELIKLAGESVETKARLAEAQEWNAKLQSDVEAAVAWAAKLEQNVAASTAWAAKLERDTAAWIAKVERESKAWSAKLEMDIAELKREIERLADENRRFAPAKAAFHHLPELVRKYLLRRVSRARR